MTLRKFLGFPVPCSPNFVWFLATWGIWSFPGQGSDLNLSYDLRQPQQRGILCQAGDRTCVPALERHHWIYWATVETSISQFLKRCRRRSLKINLAKKPSASLPKQFHITSPQLNLSFQGHTAFFFSTSFPLLLKVAHFFPSGVNRPDLIQSVPPSKKKKNPQTKHIYINFIVGCMLLNFKEPSDSLSFSAPFLFPNVWSEKKRWHIYKEKTCRVPRLPRSGCFPGTLFKPRASELFCLHLFWLLYWSFKETMFLLRASILSSSCYQRSVPGRHSFSSTCFQRDENKSLKIEMTGVSSND